MSWNRSQWLRRSRGGVAAAALAAAVTVGAVIIAPSAQAETGGVENVINGSFDNGIAPWWGTPNTTLSVVNGQLCTPVPAGTTNRWDVIVGHNDINIVQGETYQLSFFASANAAGRGIRALVGLAVPPYDAYVEGTPTLNVAGDQYTYTFTAATSTPQGQVAFQVGGSAEAWTFCVDNVSLKGGVEKPTYKPDTGPRVRVNQFAYLPGGPKNATVVTESTKRLTWELKNAQGLNSAKGQTVPRGKDPTTGLNVHTIDFSSYRNIGKGFTIVADGETSRPFDIDPRAYESLRADALKFFYTQRSGIAIDDTLRPGYGRPAGHINVAPNTGDANVPCQAGVCDYTQDVTGGWYDAGDHGKYVVNGGISTWQLLNQYERSTLAKTADKAKLGDGTLAIPESGNGIPDILDEVRWEVEFLLKMQVPAGKPQAGMAFHKVHDDAWTGLPLLPNMDDKRRELHPPSTAATLNLAAVAAQSARLYSAYDSVFAGKALNAARIAWDAAVANPASYATSADAIGGGAYEDNNVADDFYWAAAELYVTTGDKKYSDYLMKSPVHTADVFGRAAMDWANTAAAGRIALATVPHGLPGREEIKKSVVAGADKYLAMVKDSPWGVAYTPAANNGWDWGSNSQVLNNLMVMAVAFDLTGKTMYRDGVLKGFDYILGRNALNMSYVTGYGEVNSHNQHSRWYSHQVDPTLPNPPKGTLAGGPNTSIQDPFAQGLISGCVGQFCYVDDIQSWSTNELALNWNSTLAWLASFVADQS